jgi:hypothetical protein
MSSHDENPRRYHWPRLALAAFLLGVALAVLWLSGAVHHIAQERNMNAPLPAGRN